MTCKTRLRSFIQLTFKNNNYEQQKHIMENYNGRNRWTFIGNYTDSISISENHTNVRFRTWIGIAQYISWNHISDAFKRFR